MPNIFIVIDDLEPVTRYNLLFKGLRATITATKYVFVLYVISLDFE
jgi:hypothetical protein